MLSITESLGYRKATVGALHGCASGVHRDRCTASFFRFAGQDTQELAPGSITDALSQTVIMHHASDVQVFKGDEIVPLDKFSSCLVSEVRPLPSDLQVGFGYQGTSFASPRRPLDLSREALLPRGQQVLPLPEVFRVFDRGSTIRENGEGLQTDINTDRVAWLALLWGIAQIAREDGIPLITQSLQRNSLDLPFNWPVQLDLHSAHILHIQAIREPDAIAIGGEGDRIKAISSSEARVPWLLTGLATPEESLEGLVQASQDVLSGRVVQTSAPGVLLPDSLQLIGLVIVVDRNAVLPGIAPFLEGSVVEGASDIQQANESLFLASVWVETVDECLAHLFALLLLDIPLDSLRRDMPDSADIVRARPEVRQAALEKRELLTQLMCAHPFELVHDLLRGEGRREAAKQVDVIRLDCDVQNFAAHAGSLFPDDALQPSRKVASQNTSPELRYPDEVIIHVVGGMSGSFTLHDLMIPHSVKRKEEGAIPRPR